MKLIPRNKKGGSSKNWIQKAVNPKHRGYCTPVTKKTCTPRRKALATRFKSDEFKKHKNGGELNFIKELCSKFDKGGQFSSRYMIQKGDTLSKISKIYNIPIQELAEANKIKDINKIKYNQTLQIPEKYEKELKIDEIPEQYHPHRVIDNFSNKYDYLVQGDKLYYKIKNGNTWGDVSENTQAKNNIYSFLKDKYNLKGYSPEEQQIANALKVGNYDYKESLRRNNSKQSTKIQKSEPIDNKLFITPVEKQDNIRFKLNKIPQNAKIINPIFSSAEPFFSEKALQKIGNDYFKLGKNYISRLHNKYNNQVEQESKISVNSEKAEDTFESNIPRIKNINHPIITGDTVKINKNRYYLPEIINLNKVTLGSRNRGDYNELKTEGAIVTAFNPFQNYSKIKPSSNFDSYIGINNNGEFRVGNYKDFDNSFKLSKTFKNSIKNFVYDEKGKPKLVRWNDNVVINGERVGNKDNPRQYVPLVKVIDDYGKERVGSLNFLIKDLNNTNTFGDITGGRIILKSGNEVKLVSGGIQNIIDEFNRMKNSEANTIDFYTLDNGTYSRGLRTKNQVLSPSDLKNYDLENSGGGNFLYLTNKYNTKTFTSPNIRTEEDESYKKGHSLVNEKQGFVLHHTGFENPNLSEVDSLFMQKNKYDPKSAHVLIGYNGERHVFADPNNVAFHAGTSSFNGRDNVNDFMLGVEFQGNTAKKPLTEDQIKSFIEYSEPIIRKNKINVNNIVTHEMIAPGRKKDITQDQYNRVMQMISEYYK